MGREYNRTPEGRYRKLKHKAKSKNLALEITLEQYRKIIEPGACHYCKGPLDQAGYNLDRKDNSLGYLIDNVVPCCGRCNSIKCEHLTYNEMIVLSATLRALGKVGVE